MNDIYRGEDINAFYSKYSTALNESEVVSPSNDNTFEEESSLDRGPKTSERNAYFDTYTIQKGDTLYEIARKFNTDYNLLALLNGLNITDYIYPNTTLLVPKRDVKYYLTKNNDTLSSVNKLLNANISNLLRQNQNIYLREGQLIIYKD